MGNIPNILIAPGTGRYGPREVNLHAEAVTVAGGYSFTPHLPQPDSNEADYIPNLRKMYKPASGVLLIGGADCDPARYCEERIEGTDEPVKERDYTYFALIKWAIKDNKPLLAICVGEQILNVFYGGTLHQDIFKQLNADINHKDNLTNYAAHPVKVVSENELVQEIYGAKGQEFYVNSSHKQAVKKLGEGLEVILESPDGIIEGFINPNLSFFWALQFHPELMWQVQGQESHLEVYKALVKHAGIFE